MNRLLFGCFVVVSCAWTTLAQTPVSTAGSFGHAEQITPQFVPNVATDVWTRNVYLEALTLSNETGSAATCTIQDKQDTPRAYFKAVSIAANSTYNDQHVSRRYFPGGITWSCSASNAVTGYMRVIY